MEKQTLQYLQIAHASIIAAIRNCAANECTYSHLGDLCIARDAIARQISSIEYAPYAAYRLYRPHRFPETWCSQCGQSLGSGNSGLSHCIDHRQPQLAMKESA